MSTSFQAQSAYKQAAQPIRTERGTEYAIFAQVTHGLTTVDETDKSQYGRLADAVQKNQRLWSALAEDLLLDTNGLPVSLRAQLVSLAEFVRKHTLAVLAGRASVAPLVDINSSIMRGLRGNLEATA